ncbi:hypothetical protein GCM10022215_35080 [Nocardioides fonticola]|uniref:Uncharacterized protein n=1 Tax=Nocardioides fonticola TaxID=450363 RepID=A0ABP7XUS8_9ACTN
MISKRRQTIVLTAVPRGWDDRGTSVRIGVHISPRLSYTGSGATLEDFPAWLDWPAQQLAWQVSWDAGNTWAAAASVDDDGDSGFWKAILRPEVPVTSFDGTPPPAASVAGYSYAGVAAAVLSSFTRPTLAATDAGRAAITAARVREPLPDNRGAKQPTAAFTALRGFYRPRTPVSTQVSRGSLEPDFHERLSLMSDHGPLLERLGLVVELTATPPSSTSSVSSVMVRTTWKPGGSVPATVLSTRTACALKASASSRIFRALPASGSLLDTGLRYRLDDDAYSVHSLDVDGAAAQLLGVATGPDAKTAAPPAGRSAGLTLAMANRAIVVQKQIARARQVAATLVSGHTPLLYADDLAVGAHVQVSPADAGDAWFGLGHRRVEYRADTGTRVPLSFTAVDEAAVTVAARAQKPGSPNLLVSDVVARFDGWSVAVPRPGRQMIQTAEGSSVEAEPERAPLTWLTMDATVPDQAADGTDGRLASLRFGRSYVLRARAVDVTGRGMGEWSGAPATADTPYYRWDPVPAPLVLPPPATALTAGEAARRIVVRSDPASGLGPQVPSVRTLVPPRVAVEVGLLHGVFDAAGGHAPDAASWKRIADLDAGAPPQQGPAPDVARPAAAAEPTAPATTRDPGVTPTVVPSTSPSTSPITTAPSSTAPSSGGAGPSTGPSTSPTTGPTTGPSGPPDATPRPLDVDWLPDPLATGVVVAPDGGSEAVASFLPPGASPTGFAEIGSWNSVALRARPGALGSPAVLTDPVVGTADQQVVTVTLAPAEVRTVKLRARPTPTLLGMHGLVSQLGGSPADQAAAVASGKVPILTPSIEVEVVHAVRAPLEAPIIDDIAVTRRLGQKDADVTTGLRYHRLSTGGLTVRASWSQWRDDGPGTPAPVRTLVRRHVVLDQTLDPSTTTGLMADLDATPTLVLPDLRRFSPTFEAVATSRFVEEWREAIPVSAVKRSDGALYVVLPDDVDVESVLLDLDGRRLARGTEIATAIDPDTEHVTLVVLDDTLAKAFAKNIVTGVGVRGSVLRTSAPRTLTVRSGVRPEPVRPRYVVPSFTIVPGTSDGAGSSAARLTSGLRLWLERPWWSSGDGEQLAVITGVDKATLGTEDTTRLEKLVTTYGADPALRAGESVPRTGALTSGTEVTRLPIAEELGSTIKPTATFTARMHDVAYDAERDAYWVDLTFADLAPGAFVRLAVARYQPLMAAAAGTNLAEAVTLSRIVTLDPVQLLPARTARLSRSGGALVTRIGGKVHRGASEQTRPVVRVSLQEKPGGGPDTGWQTVAAAVGIATDTGYPDVSLPAASASPQRRVVVEEFDRWPVGLVSGAAAPPNDPATLVLEPRSVDDARRDFAGLRPVWVATLPLPS